MHKPPIDAVVIAIPGVPPVQARHIYVALLDMTGRLRSCKVRHRDMSPVRGSVEDREVRADRLAKPSNSHNEASQVKTHESVVFLASLHCESDRGQSARRANFPITKLAFRKLRAGHPPCACEIPHSRASPPPTACVARNRSCAMSSKKRQVADTGPTSLCCAHQDGGDPSLCQMAGAHVEAPVRLFDKSCATHRKRMPPIRFCLEAVSLIDSGDCCTEVRKC